MKLHYRMVELVEEEGGFVAAVGLAEELSRIYFEIYYSWPCPWTILSTLMLLLFWT